MKAYNNDPKLKEDFLKELQWHQDQDMIIKGTYASDEDGKWKGCAVGCALHSLNKIKGTEFNTSDHAELAKQIFGGLEMEWLARLEDTLFENLPEELSKTWPMRFSEAINVGADLTKVKWQFSAFLMKENIDRVLVLDISEELKEQVVSAIRGVLKLNTDAIETGVWDESAARSARSARFAESAARSAAWSARSASSSWSAESAAWSARSAARSARSAAFIKHSEELIKLLKECK